MLVVALLAGSALASAGLQRASRAQGRRSAGARVRAAAAQSDGWEVVPAGSCCTALLGGISAVSSTDAWVVGDNGAGGAETTVIFNWDGSAWRTVSSPNAGQTNILSAVAFESASDGWAVGSWQSSTSTRSRPLIEHFDGAGWSLSSPDELMGRLVQAPLRAVAADSPTDAWAVGAYVDSSTSTTGPLVEHWNGGSWTAAEVGSPSTSNNAQSLVAVAAISPSDVWAVGSDFAVVGGQPALIMHWDGSTWSKVTAPTPPTGCAFSALKGVTAVSSNDVWAVGRCETSSFTTAALVEHWDGSAWSVMSAPAPSNSTLNAVSAGSAHDVWAVGGYSDSSGFHWLTEHYDGTGWSVVPSPTPPSNVPLGWVSTLPSGEAWATFGGFNSTLHFTTGPPPPPPENPLADALRGPGSPSLDYSCPPCNDPVAGGGAARAPVNSATGDFYRTWDELSVPGRGVPLSFSQTYSSALAGRDSPLGPGWTDSYNLFLSFDASGKVTVHEESGSQVSFTLSGSTYTPPSYVLASLVKNGDGSYTFTRDKTQLAYRFDSSGRLVRESDRNGYQTNLAYNGSGQLASVTDPAGRALSFSYGGNGKLASLTDPGGRTVRFAYDGAGNLSQLTDVAAGAWSFGYDAGHLLTSLTDPRGGRTTNTYTGSGQVSSQSDPLGRVTNYAYTAGTGGASTTLVTDPAGHQTRLAYQDLRVTSLTRGFGTAQAATTGYTYDPATFDVAAQTDPNGHTTSSSYDARGNLLSRTDPLGRSWQYTYNVFNEPLTKTDPLGVSTTFSYDANGNLTAASTPVGSQVSRTTYAYGDSSHPGDLTATTDPDGNTTTFGYDANGDRTNVTDPAGDTTGFAYNTIGELTSTTSPKGNVTSSTYDLFGDLASVTDPLGHTTGRSYDPDRNLVALTDANGHTTSYAYDADNERTSETLADGSTRTTAYNPDGTVHQQVDGRGNTTSFGYDPLGRVTSTSDPLGRTWSALYDRAGNRLSRTDPAGRTTSYSYDAADEPTAIAYSDGSTPNVSFTYDGDGRRTSMADGTGTTSYAYDALGRLTGSSDGAGKTVSYAYDLAGNLTKISYPGGNAISRAYDRARRLTAVGDWLGNTTSFGYDRDSKLVSETYPNKVVASFSYDRADRLATISDAKGGKNLLSLAYSRDRLGLVTAENTSTYGYDPANRLTSGAASTYAYDAADEITAIGAARLAYDSANELSSFAQPSGRTTSYSYDRQGNRTATTPPTGPATSYAYDQASRLIGFSHAGASASYAYNGDGLRTQKTVNGTSTPFVWDTAEGPLLLQAGTTSYLTGPDGLPVEEISSAGTVLYYHQDQLGSTRLLTDASGKVAASFTYDPYGNLSASTGTASTPFGFAGQYTDAESGLIYLRARSYDPASAQFLSVDPLATLTREPYPYVHDDPVNLTDPSGQDSEGEPVGAIVYVRGIVLVQRAGSNAWFFAYRNMPIYLGDKVANASESGSALEYVNGTQIGINEDTTVLIDTEGSVEDISIRSRLKKFKLSLGGLWCRITHQSADESFTVETRGGVLGTREAFGLHG